MTLAKTVTTAKHKHIVDADVVILTPFSHYSTREKIEKAKNLKWLTAWQVLDSTCGLTSGNGQQD